MNDREIKKLYISFIHTEFRSFTWLGLGGIRTLNQRLKRATIYRVTHFVLAEYLPDSVLFCCNSQQFASV